MTSYKGPSEFDSIPARDQAAAMANLWAVHVDALIEEEKAAKQKGKQETAIAMEALVKATRERR